MIATTTRSSTIVKPDRLARRLTGFLPDWSKVRAMLPPLIRGVARSRHHA
jgi:hypothetical protein